MRLARTKIVLLVVALAICAIRTAYAAPFRGFPAAPPELAAYGFTTGMLLHEDPEAAYFLTEFDERDAPIPALLAVVTIVRAGADGRFVAVETMQAPGTAGAAPRRRLADSAVTSFGAGIGAAMAGAPGAVATELQVRQFVYVRGRHFAPTDYFAAQKKYRRPAYEEPLLDIWWQRARRDAPFQPHEAFRKGMTAEEFPVTLAEVGRTRAPGKPAPPVQAVAARNDGSGTRAAAPSAAPSPAPSTRPADRPTAARSEIVELPARGPFNLPPTYWQQRDDGVRRTWREAIAYCEDLELGGFTDWTLPSHNQIAYITTGGRPGIRTRYFPDIVDGTYWTSSVRQDIRAFAVYVAFGGGAGLLNDGPKDAKRFALCTRNVNY